MSELRPCPFCGGEPKIFGNEGIGYKRAVQCINEYCSLQEMFSTTAWNTRPLEDELELVLDDMRLGRAIAERKVDRVVDRLNFYVRNREFSEVLYEFCKTTLAEMSNSNSQKPPQSVRYPLDGDPHVFQPFTLGTKPNGHCGIDWDVPVGTPVHAIADGTVCLMAQDTETYGRFIALLHDDGYSSWYAHLSKTLVHKLDNVKAGQVIGLTGGAVGSDGAGQSTGWHLHFEVRTPGNLDNNKKNVDPMKYIESLVTK